MRKMSQMPTMPAMPPMDPAIGGGMPPMDPSMGGMPPAPMGAMPMGAPPMGGDPAMDPPIPGPLESIGEIIYDFDLDKFIAAHGDQEEDELAKAVWEAYGGLPNGKADPSKTGSRDQNSSQRDPSIVAQEVQSTMNQKWMRLPRGKTIADVTSLD